MKKVLMGVFLVVMMSLTAGCGMSEIGYLSDEPCVWCDGTPTKQISGDTEESYYYCEDCVTTCFWCEDEATKHYTCGFEVEAFVCDDCYDEITGY